MSDEVSQYIDRDFIDRARGVAQMDERAKLDGIIEYDPAKPFIPAIVPAIKTEADIVADFKQRASEIMKQFCLLMDEANKAGFRIQFQGIAFNTATMRNEIVDLHLVKRY